MWNWARHVPSADGLPDLLVRLGVAREDASEVLRTLPSEHDSELCGLLERSCDVRMRSFASRDNRPQFLPLPAASPLLPVHVILVSLAAILGLAIRDLTSGGHSDGA